jgi:hypothetical protein
MTANVIDGVLPLQGSPLISRPEIWRSRSLFYLVPGGHILVGLLLAHYWLWGVQNPLAADQGETVPGAVPLYEAGQNVPGFQMVFLLAPI